MDDPNITMEEYIRLEEEKAQKHGKVFNWETTKYGKIWYDEDVHDIRSVETEFPAIVFNDNLTSNETISCEPTVSSLNNNEIDFRISFDEFDDEDYTIVFDKNSFSYKITSTNDLKTDSENDNEIDMIQSSGDMALPPRDQRHQYFRRQVNRVHELDFEGSTPDMRHDLVERLRMVYTKDDGQEVFVSHAWRRLFRIRAPLVQEFILEFFSTCRIMDEMRLDAASILCFQLRGATCSMTWRQFILALGLLTVEEMTEDGFRAYWDFLRCAPSYTYIRDPIRRLCHRLISYCISERGHTEGRKRGAKLSGGHFIRCLAHHFGLVSDDGLRGLSVATREISLIDMVDEGAQVDPAPMQAPQPPPPPPATGSTMPQRLGRLKEEM
ncbi:hypothetical protein Tco_0550400 [Tanacetum coccineum]